MGGDRPVSEPVRVTAPGDGTDEGVEFDDWLLSADRGCCNGSFDSVDVLLLDSVRRSGGAVSF